MSELFGVVAEFHSKEELVNAARQCIDHGYQRVEAYSPFAVEELDEIIRKPNRLPFTVLIGGITGAVAAYALQEYIAVWYYPLNVGGRPLNSWPAFIVITFEMTILFAAAAAFFGTLFFAGLPAPYHPLSNSAAFSLASQDRFFLCVEAGDPKFLHDKVHHFLEGLSPEQVEDVYA